MATRFCPGCGADVEDAGGFCLLGHRLTLAPTGLQDLHDEMATAFEVARGQMENSLRLTAATTPLSSGEPPMGYTPRPDPSEGPSPTSTVSPQAAAPTPEVPSQAAGPVISSEVAAPTLSVSPATPTLPPRVERTRTDAAPATEASESLPAASPQIFPPSPVAPPPPPPPPPGAPDPVWGPSEPQVEEVDRSSDGYWQKVWGAGAPEDVLSDPITAFAPPPSMNWGPDGRQGKKGLRSRLRKGA